MKEIKPALVMLLLFTVLCGGIYPAVVTGLAQVMFPQKARGSFITDQTGKVMGSAMIGQPFTDPKYLWPRPSASADFAYNPLGSGGSNASPASPACLKTVTRRLQDWRAAGLTGPLPAELVQASASGLDPHLSPLAATLQAARIARARGLDQTRVLGIINAHQEGRQLGVMGAPRVSVLAVNLALDKIRP